METTKKRAKYKWYNKLSSTDRVVVTQLYLQGYGLYAIGVAFGVTASTVEYHLKNADVFVAGTKPTLYTKQNPIVLPKKKAQRTLTVFKTKDTTTHYFDEYGERYARPKSYAQLLAKSKRLEIARRQRADTRNQEGTQNGFRYRVNLLTGATIERKDGHYHIYRTREDGERATYSDGVLSW